MFNIMHFHPDLSFLTRLMYSSKEVKIYNHVYKAYTVNMCRIMNGTLRTNVGNDITEVAEIY